MSKGELDQNEQLELLKKRLTDAGMSRRDVLKVAAAAAAGSAMTIGGVALRPSEAAAQTGEEQIFYHDGIWTNPTSFDWNLNLYCNAEEETFAGLLTFDENLEAT